ncbi:MAG: DUF5011 domain-containing protein, partial [Erysipelotrichaceae bacterium]
VVRMMSILIAITLSLGSVAVWFVSNNLIWDKTLKVDKQELNVNEKLLMKEYPVISAENRRIKIGSSFNPKSIIKVNDIQDGDISNQVQTYGKIDTNQKGIYQLRIVAINSYGLKSIKNIQVIVD